MEQTNQNKRRFQTECRRPELFVLEMLTQSPGVDIGCVSKTREGQGRGETQVGDLKSMVLNGSSLTWISKSPTEAFLELEMETTKQLPKSSMDEQDWEEKTARKGGISEWHVHKRRG